MTTLRKARRAVAAVVGFTLLLAGAVMLISPGPGWLTIFLGLSVLSAEFVWARRLLRRLKQRAARVSQTVLGKTERTPHSQPLPRAAPERIERKTEKDC